MLGSVLIFLLVLSVLVLAHELGHFWMARKLGVKVEEFGFGLPPRLIGITVGETIYSLNLFPFGGFVRLYGEDPGEKIKNSGRSFSGKSKKVRFAVIIAGVVMNFLLGVAAFGVVYSFSGVPRQTKEVKVVEVVAGSPAQTAGILVGDIIKVVDKIPVYSVAEFVETVEAKKGKRVVIETQDKKVTLTPRENPPEGEGPLGVVITATQIYYPPVVLRPFWGIYYGFKDAVFWGKTVVLGFGNIIAGVFKGQVPQDITGPVGIFAVTSQAAEFGILALINFMGILSVNLAILNIIPFPALDGGRLLFIGLERIIGRKVLPKIESVAHGVGMVILLFLILLITVHDVGRLIKAGSISGFLQGVIK